MMASYTEAPGGKTPLRDRLLHDARYPDSGGTSKDIVEAIVYIDCLEKVLQDQ